MAEVEICEYCGREWSRLTSLACCTQPPSESLFQRMSRIAKDNSKMQSFIEIPGSIAVVRNPRGIFAESKLYHYNGKVFVKGGGGYIRIGAKFSGIWATSNPLVKVLDFAGEGVENNNLTAPTWKGV